MNNTRLFLVLIALGLGGFLVYSVLHKKPACTDPVCTDPNCKPPPVQVQPPPVDKVQPPAPQFVPGKKYSYTEGLSLSKATKTQMFVLFGADWCAWCKKLDKTLQDPQITTVTNKYIFVYVDVDKEKDVATRLKVSGRGVPAYLMVNDSEQVLKSGSGYKAVPAMKRWFEGAAGDEEPGPTTIRE